jgi:hypothetical protein
MKNKKQIVGAKLLCLALLFLAAPHSFAIIRSPYPAKSFPPYRGHVTVIGGDSIPAAAKNNR